MQKSPVPAAPPPLVITRPKSLSAAADRILAALPDTAAGQVSKTTLLNALAREILGPKHDWGAIARASGPVIDQRIDRERLASLLTGSEGAHDTAEGATPYTSVPEELFRACEAAFRLLVESEETVRDVLDALPGAPDTWTVPPEDADSSTAQDILVRIAMALFLDQITCKTPDIDFGTLPAWRQTFAVRGERGVTYALVAGCGAGIVAEAGEALRLAQMVYQITHAKTDLCWKDRPSFEVLDAVAASREVIHLRAQVEIGAADPDWGIDCLHPGDVEEPTLETDDPDHLYTALATSPFRHVPGGPRFQAALVAGQILAEAHTPVVLR